MRYAPTDTGESDRLPYLPARPRSRPLSLTCEATQTPGSLGGFTDTAPAVHRESHSRPRVVCIKKPRPPFSRCALQTSSMGITGGWLEMQNLGPHPDLRNQDLPVNSTLQMALRQSISNKVHPERLCLGFYLTFVFLHGSSVTARTVPP